MKKKVTPKGVVVGKKSDVNYVKPLIYGIICALFGIVAVVLDFTVIDGLDTLILVLGCLFVAVGAGVIVYSVVAFNIPIDAVTVYKNEIYVRKFFGYVSFKAEEVDDVLEFALPRKKRTGRYSVTFFLKSGERINTLCMENADKAYKEITAIIPDFVFKNV